MSGTGDRRGSWKNNEKGTERQASHDPTHGSPMGRFLEKRAFLEAGEAEEWGAGGEAS